MKRVAIIQSSYVPWRGYFDIIGLVDEFILLDEVQFTKRDWRNRNRIKTAQGLHWLTIPVRLKGRYTQRIDEVEVSDDAWAEKHWMTLRHAYAAAPCFDSLEPVVRGLYEELTTESRLCEINRRLLEGLSGALGISTPLVPSTRYPSEGVKTERLLSVCRAAGADEYVSGPSARDYLDEQVFEANGIAVRWMDYEGYPDYPQLHPPFAAGVSIVDLLFNTGPQAARYLRHAADADPGEGGR